MLADALVKRTKHKCFGAAHPIVWDIHDCVTATDTRSTSFTLPDMNGRSYCGKRSIVNEVVGRRIQRCC